MHFPVSELVHQRDRLFNRQARHNAIIASDHRVRFEQRIQYRFFRRFDDRPKHVVNEIALLDDLLGGVRQCVGEMFFAARRAERDG
jgi:hypothetical protein